MATKKKTSPKKVIRSEAHRETLVVLYNIMDFYLKNGMILAPAEGSGIAHEEVMQKGMDHLVEYTGK